MQMTVQPTGDTIMRLRAVVREVTGNTRHLWHGAEASPFPDPIAVEIVEEEGAFFLFRLDESGECIADTWHETVEAAKAQAEFEYKIKNGDWREV